jgi:hypothetical protein
MKKDVINHIRSSSSSSSSTGALFGSSTCQMERTRLGEASNFIGMSSLRVTGNVGVVSCRTSTRRGEYPLVVGGGGGGGWQRVGGSFQNE